MCCTTWQPTREPVVSVSKVWKPSIDNHLLDCAVQNAIVFQAFGIASRHLLHNGSDAGSPLSYPQTFLSGAHLVMKTCCRLRI